MAEQFSSEDCLRLQLRLECIGFDEAGRLVRIPGPEPDDIGRVYVYRTDAGDNLFLRSDVSTEIESSLLALGPDVAFSDASAVLALLASDTASGDEEVEVSRWRTYRLTAPDPATYEGVITLTEAYRSQMEVYHPGMVLGERPVHAWLVDDPEGEPVIAATCASIRENGEVAEAYVFTSAEWRRRGFGRWVTAAWAAGVLAEGKVPLYSHALDNTASARLVERIPADFCFEAVVYG